jgi:dephospho-CoA kinase
MIIYGVGGTNGSGKDTASEVLAQYGFYVASATEMLEAELKSRGLPTDRINKRTLSAEWRREHGLAVVVDKAIEAAKSAGADKMIVGSLRHPSEADRVHELGGKVLWIDADAHIRYDRITSNDRGRVEDRKTFEQFLEDEEAEKRQSGDEATLSTEAVKERADIFLNNDGSVEDFKNALLQELNII